MSPADMAAVTGGGRNNDSFCGDGLMYLIILFFFVFCGWGNGAWGGNGGGSGYDTRADLQRGFDNQSVVTKLDGISHGICDSTYALNTSINTLGTNVMQGFSNAELSRCNQQAALMQQLFNMSAQNQSCCCETQRLLERGFADTNYNLATQSCETRNTIQNTTRDIIDNQNSNARAILDAMNQSRLEALQAENQTLKLAASQANQNAVLMAAMDANKAEILRRTGNDCPVSAYVVQPPTPVNFPTNCCGTFNGWGGGNNGCACNCA